MLKRCLGRATSCAAVMIATCAVVPPGTALAASYDVLVVASKSDAVSKAGIDTIRSAGKSAGFSVTAPAPADVGDQFSATRLERYSAVVFLNTGATSPLTDAQRASFEEYFHDGGGFVGIGSAIVTDPSWQFLSDILGTRAAGRTAAQSGAVKVYDRVHDATKGLPEYWNRTDQWWNFTANVRGVSHVLATVVEDPFGPQPQGNTLDGIEGGTMGFDHPVSWCKDYQGGRSFYTALGNTAAAFDGSLTTHLRGAISWAAGRSDPAYSDCGATVLANYEQTKISAPPNLNEPIGFDQLPDGRIIQTARTGTVRLHDPATGTTQILADFASPALPLTQRIYTNSEDGLYGPAVDRNFAQNKWVYLFYSPQTVTDVKLSDGSVVTQTTPSTNSPASAPSKSAWDPWVGYFQLSRFKFVEDASGPRLNLGSEQQILRVPVNRQECCHVAGDIDFDRHNTLWMVTGDDTPAGGINAGGMGPFNDQLTDEQQTVRAQGATGGTFTLTFKGQTTAPLPFDATAVQVDAALEALSTVGANNVQVAGGPVNSATATTSVYFRRALQQADQPQLTGDGAGLTGATLAIATPQEGGWFQRPSADARRGALNTNDLRGKVLRMDVKAGDIGGADANKADFGSGTGAYTVPSGNLFPLVGGAPQQKTRAEVYAMGFRNPFRIQVDEDDVAYVSDYSPDSRVNVRGRGPAGTGRFEIVRKPSSYGWPVCYKRDLGFNRWSHHEWPATTPLTPAPNTNTQGVPATDPPTPLVDCGGASILNTSRWNLEGGSSVEPGLAQTPPVTDPDIWYSYNDNAPGQLLGTPCAAYFQLVPGPTVPGSLTECPRLFPEFGTGGVGPHGSAKYDYDPDNPNPKKFPPYYDGSVILGEFTRDMLREAKLDSQNRVMKVNSFLDCGAFGSTAFQFECDSPMDMQFGADGAFYLLTYGDGFFNVNADAGMYRWEYVKSQRAPKVVLGTDRTDGPTPLTVNFSSEGSLDPDPGDSIRFEWDFGDGTPVSTESNPTHTYTQAGRYTARLTVFDSTGRQTSASTVITAGNTSPSIAISVPPEGGTFAFGDKIPFAVTVTDPEDGVIACSDVQVTFVLAHDNHGHAEESKAGCSGFLQTIVDDVSHGGNVWGTINVRYTDKGGPGGVPSLTTIAETNVRQRRQQVEHALSQSGTNTAANADEGGGEHRGSLGNGDWIRLNGPFDLVDISAITFRTSGGSGADGTGLVELRRDAVDGPIVGTYTIQPTADATTFTSQTFPITDPGGTNELFLVFRPVAGGPANNFFNLNWVEFVGEGVGTP
jgi:PKD repeat protein/glucose/arabinose dehydrogenase